MAQTPSHATAKVCAAAQICLACRLHPRGLQPDLQPCCALEPVGAPRGLRLPPCPPGSLSGHSSRKPGTSKRTPTCFQGQHEWTLGSGSFYKEDLQRLTQRIPLIVWKCSDKHSSAQWRTWGLRPSLRIWSEEFQTHFPRKLHLEQWYFPTCGHAITVSDNEGG